MLVCIAKPLASFAGDPVLRRGGPAVLVHAVLRLGRAVERGRVAVRASRVDPQQRRRAPQGLGAHARIVSGLCASAELAGNW